MKALKFESATYIECVETAIHNCYTTSVEPSNEQLMALYQTVGQAIVSQGEKAFVVFLADYLKCNFPSLKGFSPRNLRRMRNFYLTYQTDARLMTEALQLNWTQNVIIMEYCENNEERSFYIALVGKAKLSKLALIAEIEMANIQECASNDDDKQVQSETIGCNRKDVVVIECDSNCEVSRSIVDDIVRKARSWYTFGKKSFTITWGCSMASKPIYQFYVELNDYEPKIWRRFQVMSNASIARLGYIIMVLFKMEANHLFCIEADLPNGKIARYEVRNDFSEDYDDAKVFHAPDYTLPTLFTLNCPEAIMQYDYGDGWEVRIVLESITEDKELSGRLLPRVLSGEGYGIVEDCGGTGGLEEVVSAFKKKAGDLYNFYSEALNCKELDFLSFDIEVAGQEIKQLPKLYVNLYECSEFE